jgi:hypothetical protein
MELHILESKVMEKNFADTTLTLSVEKMKSDTYSFVRPRVKLYDIKNGWSGTKNNNFWINGNQYQSHSATMTFNANNIERCTHYQVVLECYNVTKDNNIYFNHIQLCEGDNTEYHQPEQDLPTLDIKFSNNFYANVYTSQGDRYLQIIRPYYDNINTKMMKRSKATVLAPHIENEESVDKPSSLGLEFMNQHEQVIEILR